MVVGGPPYAAPQPTMRLKVLVLGETKSGKTSLINRYRWEHHSKIPSLAMRYRDDEFTKQHIPTLGVEFMDAVKVCQRKDNNDTLRVVTSFYDVGGDARWLKVRSEFYTDYSGILLVFDTTSRTSFSGLQYWVDECLKFGGNKKPENVMVVGNKTDDTIGRLVSVGEAKQWCSERKFMYRDASAASGEGVVTAVEDLLNKCSAQYKQPNFNLPKSSHTFANAQRRQSMSGTGSAASSRPSSSAGGSSFSSTLTDPDTMSMKDIKAELSFMRVAMDDCLEKGDFIKKLKEARAGVNHAFLAKEAERKRKQAAKQRIEEEERTAEQLKDKTNKEVDSWTKGKDIRSMLNEILGNSAGDDNYLNRMSGLEKVAKLYKKAMLKIHPDKVNVNDTEAHARATEMFKAVNTAYENFKKQNEGRGSISTADTADKPPSQSAGRGRGRGKGRR